MAWTTPRTWVHGELVTATIGNTHWRDNLNELRAGGIAIASQATNDLIYASSATQLARLANGSSGQLLLATGGAAPSWTSMLLLSAGAGTGTFGNAAGSPEFRINASATGNPTLALQQNGTSRAFLYFNNATGAVHLSRVGGSSGLTLDASDNLASSGATAVFGGASGSPEVRINAGATGNPTFTLEQNGTDRGYLYFNNSTGRLHLTRIGGDSGVRLDSADDVFLSGEISERGRTTPIGEWIDVAHNGANFTAGGSMTWTVASADQLRYSYTLIGKTMILDVNLTLTTVGGTPAQDLRVAIPGGFTAIYFTVTTGIGKDNGTVVPLRVRSVASTYIEITRQDFANWAASTNLTDVQFTIAFGIQ